MKIVAAVMIGLALLLQFCLFTAWSGEMVIPNLTLAVLVMLSFYIDTEQMMWLALLAGLFTDLYSHAEFGLFIGLYILVVLVCKVVLNLSNSHRSWWLATVVLAVSALVQGLFMLVPLISSSFANNAAGLIEQVLWLVVLTTGFGLLVYVLLRFGNQTVSRYFAAKAG